MFFFTISTVNYTALKKLEHLYYLCRYTACKYRLVLTCVCDKHMHSGGQGGVITLSVFTCTINVATIMRLKNSFCI